MPTSEPEESAEQQAHYRWFCDVTTRWMDNDIYGHVNNVAYYSYFDTAMNLFLIRVGGLDIVESPVIGVVVESHCRYRESLAYPDLVRAGLRVDKLGNRSVTYGIGIFREHGNEACAHGYVTHVFVDRKNRRAVPIPDSVRQALLTIL